jgi:hypothetical protein
MSIDEERSKYSDSIKVSLQDIMKLMDNNKSISLRDTNGDINYKELRCLGILGCSECPYDNNILCSYSFSNYIKERLFDE